MLTCLCSNPRNGQSARDPGCAYGPTRRSLCQTLICWARMPQSLDDHNTTNSIMTDDPRRPWAPTFAISVASLLVYLRKSFIFFTICLYDVVSLDFLHYDHWLSLVSKRKHSREKAGTTGMIGVDEARFLGFYFFVGTISFSRSLRNLKIPNLQGLRYSRCCIWDRDWSYETPVATPRNVELAPVLISSWHSEDLKRNEVIGRPNLKNQKSLQETDVYTENEWRSRMFTHLFLSTISMSMSTSSNHITKEHVTKV